MSTPLPPAIEVEDRWPESYRFLLPRRDMGPMRWIGVILLLIGGVAWLAIAASIATIFFDARLLSVRYAVGALIFFAVPTCGGLLPIWWGLAILIGRRELSIAHGKLRSRERIGLLRLGKSWDVATIETLTVTSVFNPEDPRRIPAWLHAWDALTLRTMAGGSHLVLWGYQAALLEPLARAVAERCDRARVGLSSEPHPPIGVHSDYSGVLRAGGVVKHLDNDDDDQDDASEQEEDVPEVDNTFQPAFSQIEVEEFPDGLTIKVPAGGLWKGTSGLFAFSLIWNGMMCVFTTVVVLVAVGVIEHDGDDAGWLIGLFLAGFWLVGLAVLYGALNMGLRKAAIAIAGDTLMVIQSGPFGTKRKEWPLSAVRKVVAGPSGIQVNDVDVLELQIHADDDSKFGMLAGRSDAELHWLAQLLQRTTSSLAPRETADHHAPAAESAVAPLVRDDEL